MQQISRQFHHSYSTHSLAFYQAAENSLRRAHLSLEVRQVVTEVAGATHALDAVPQLPWCLQNFRDSLSLHKSHGT